MIARVWRARVTAGMLPEYRTYVVQTGLRDYGATPGNRGAYILTRELPTCGEIMTMSLWESYEAIVAFAGEDISRARYYSQDERFLIDLPEHVDHYDVIGPSAVDG